MPIRTNGIPISIQDPPVPHAHARAEVAKLRELAAANPPKFIPAYLMRDYGHLAFPYMTREQAAEAAANIEKGEIARFNGVSAAREPEPIPDTI
jgi:hypothetical protein